MLRMQRKVYMRGGSCYWVTRTSLLSTLHLKLTALKDRQLFLFQTAFVQCCYLS